MQSVKVAVTPSHPASCPHQCGVYPGKTVNPRWMSSPPEVSPGWLAFLSPPAPVSLMLTFAQVQGYAVAPPTRSPREPNPAASASACPTAPVIRLLLVHPSLKMFDVD